jgi:hypothetical protein
LVFINDIADGMTGLGRLFADDTSIGHIANDKDSLQDMVNLDLAYLKDWSKRWLVKFNQNKTEIMVFSSRDTKPSANNLPKPVIPSAMSFINTKNNNGPKTDP